jgi:hypothetical protein
VSRAAYGARQRSALPSQAPTDRLARLLGRKTQACNGGARFDDVEGAGSDRNRAVSATARGSPSTIGGTAVRPRITPRSTGRRRSGRTPGCGSEAALAGVGRGAQPPPPQDAHRITRPRKLEDPRLDAYRELTHLGTSVRDVGYGPGPVDDQKTEGPFELRGGMSASQARTLSLIVEEHTIAPTLCKATIELPPLQLTEGEWVNARTGEPVVLSIEMREAKNHDPTVVTNCPRPPIVNSLG